jgi:hypothetical protein
MFFHVIQDVFSLWPDQDLNTSSLNFLNIVTNKQNIHLCVHKLTTMKCCVELQHCAVTIHIYKHISVGGVKLVHIC